MKDSDRYSIGKWGGSWAVFDDSYLRREVVSRHTNEAEAQAAADRQNTKEDKRYGRS